MRTLPDPAPGDLGLKGALLMVASIGGPAIAAMLAYTVMAPIKSYYRRGGLSIVAGFATVALALISTAPVDHFYGPSALLSLAALCGILSLCMAWFVRRSLLTQ